MLLSKVSAKHKRFRADMITEYELLYESNAAKKRKVYTKKEQEFFKASSRKKFIQRYIDKNHDRVQEGAIIILQMEVLY